MFSLISSQDKKILITEYRFRLVTAVFAMFSILAFLSICFLMPAYFKAKEEYDSLLSESQTVSSSIAGSTDGDIKQAIDDLKNNIGVAKLSKNMPGEVIEELVKSRPEGITLNKIEYLFETGGSTLRINGKASGRKTLTEYAKTLQSKEFFKKVDLPISNFAKETDIPFTITVTGEF